jgi:hypothetical protein
MLITTLLDTLRSEVQGKHRVHQAVAARDSYSPMSVATFVKRALIAVSLLAGTVASAAEFFVNWPPAANPASLEIRTGDAVTFQGNFAAVNAYPTNAAFTTAVGAPLVFPSNLGSNPLVFPSSFRVVYSSPGVFYYAGASGSFNTNYVVRSDLARFTVNVRAACAATPARTAVMDIDGNGSVDATTDGLLLTRYAAGMRGDALINGAIATGASRCYADDIEAYLAPRVVP